MVDAQSAAKVGAVGGAGGIAADVTVGLDRAAQAAGDVLNGIFGGLPWEMDPGAIVDAVAGSSAQVIATGLEVTVDALVMLG